MLFSKLINPFSGCFQRSRAIKWQDYYARIPTVEELLHVRVWFWCRKREHVWIELGLNFAQQCWLCFESMAETTGRRIIFAEQINGSRKNLAQVIAADTVGMCKFVESRLDDAASPRRELETISERFCGVR